jgi:hypothetical protein
LARCSIPQPGCGWPRTSSPSSSRIFEALLGDEELGTAKRARTAATLCGIALRAIERADLGARVEAVERALEARPAK